MKGLNLSSFKKIGEDRHSATMRDKDGHTLVILKSMLPALHRKQLEKLPIYKAEGGDVKSPDQKTQPNPPPQPETLGKRIGYPGFANGGAVPADQDQASTSVQPGLIGASGETGFTGPSGSMGLTGASGETGPTGLTGASGYNSASGETGSTVTTGPSSNLRDGLYGADPEQTHQNNIQQHHEQPQTPMQAQAGAFEEEKSANIAAAKAQEAQGQEERSAIENTQNEISKLPTQAALIAKNKETNDKLYDAYAKKQIDPDKYWENHSKIAAGIGMILGGIGSGLTHGPNMALEVMQNGINREIERQKNEQGRSMNLWRMNREALGNDLAANLMTQNQMYTGLKYKIDQAAANAKGPIALANAKAANAKIDQALRGNEFHYSLMNPSSDNPDPASRVQFLVPPDKQQKVFDEIDAAKNTVKGAKGIMEAFDDAAKQVRPMTGGTKTSITAFIPGMKSAGQAALIARLGPTFKDTEGTVRQAAIDNLDHNVSPQAWDNDERIASRRESLEEYLRSKEAASTALGFGIDLSKYPSTSYKSIGIPQTKQQPIRQSKSGRPMQQGADGKWYYK